MILCGDNKEIMPTFEDMSFDAIVTDPPYEISSYDIIAGQRKYTNLEGRRDIRRHMGEWDEEFDPTPFVGHSKRLLAYGGWFVAFTSDKLYGKYREAIEEHKMHFKVTITMKKVNPVPQPTQSTFLSATELIVVAMRGDKNDKKTKPVAFNWLGQTNMHNIFDTPLCGAGERLYWHIVNGEVVACKNKCYMCKTRGLDDRITHPTQKPLMAWNWLYRRLLNPGMRVLDPYLGVGSSYIAALSYGLDPVGIEIDPTYCKVAKMWASGTWGIPPTQLRMEL